MKVKYNFKLVVDISNVEIETTSVEEGKNILLKKTVEELIQLGYIETSDLEDINGEIVISEKIIINFTGGCKVCSENTQEFNSKEEAINWLEDTLDNWYFDCPEYAEKIIYPVLCQVKEENWDDELLDGTKIVSINTSFIDDLKQEEN